MTSGNYLGAKKSTACLAREGVAMHFGASMLLSLNILSHLALPTAFWTDNNSYGVENLPVCAAVSGGTTVTVINEV